MKRRTFIFQSVVAAAALSLSGATPAFAHPATRKFKISLNPGAIGVSASQEETLDLAIRHQFESISPMPDQLRRMASDALSALLTKMKTANIGWDSASLPVDFRKDLRTFKTDLEQLPSLAAACKAAGVTRMNTWIMPSHNDLTYHQNFRQHSERLREVTKVLSDYDIKLGLEYVGTKSLKTINRYPFAGTMREMLELIDAINPKTTGIQLDAYHWYTSTESVEDLLTLKNEQIITCDLNDARADRSIQDQIDGERELPGDSGAIDLKGFVGALIRIGYDGAVRAEPFNATLNAMEDEAAVARTSKAMWSTVKMAENRS